MTLSPADVALALKERRAKVCADGKRLLLLEFYGLEVFDFSYSVRRCLAL